MVLAWENVTDIQFSALSGVPFLSTQAGFSTMFVRVMVKGEGSVLPLVLRLGFVGEQRHSPYEKFTAANPFYPQCIDFQFH